MDLVDHNGLVGSTHVVGRRTENNSRHVMHAVPARVGAADPHVDGRPLAQNLLRDIGGRDVQLAPDGGALYITGTRVENSHGVLVTTAAGSNSYARAMGATIHPLPDKVNTDMAGVYRFMRENP